MTADARWAEQSKLSTTSPLYAYLAARISEDGEIASIIDVAPPAQRLGVLLLAAVHYLLLRGDGHELARHYESLGGGDAGDPYPAFRDFCLRRRTNLEHLCATRSVQTNEVRRSAYLMPAIAAIGTRVHLLEAGASAGLNLVFDRYRYDYGGHGATGDAASPVRIATEVRGGFAAPAMPSIDHRRGLDLNPLDATDPDTLLWLRACIWPEHHERRALLEAAAAVAATDPPAVTRGSATTDLADVARTLPDGPLCVLHSVVLPYVDEPGRAAFRTQLDAIASERDLYVVSGEGAKAINDVFGTSFEHGDGFCVTLTHDGETRLLGRAGFHGEWIEWPA